MRELAAFLWDETILTMRELLKRCLIFTLNNQNVKLFDLQWLKIKRPASMARSPVKTASESDVAPAAEETLDFDDVTLRGEVKDVCYFPLVVAVNKLCLFLVTLLGN